MNELIVWEGNSDNLQLSVNHSIVNDYGTSSNQLIGYSLGEEGIQIIDVEFKEAIKKADKIDYLFAVLSGILSVMVNNKFVKKTNLSSFGLDENSSKKEYIDFFRTIVSYDSRFNTDTDDIASQFEGAINGTVNEAKNHDNYKKMVVDFANGLSISSLCLSIIASLADCKMGLDEEGKLIFEKIPEDEMPNSPLKKVRVGLIRWFIVQCISYSKTGKFEGEFNNIIKFSKGIEQLKVIIKEMASTKLFKDGKVEESEIMKWIVSKINNEVEIGDDNVWNMLKKQQVPVLFNKCFVRSYYVVKKLVNQIKKKTIL